MTLPEPIQDLSHFAVPKGFRGRNAVVVQLWWIVQVTLFACSPRVCNGWRCFLMRLFGASVGRHVVIRPSARVTYPWRVVIGDYSWVGDDVVLYSLGPIRIGRHSVISQRSYLCGAGHDYTDPSFPTVSKAIAIADEVWVAADVFVAPGVSIGRGAVIGARSSVFSDMPDMMICHGFPARPIRPRLAKSARHRDGS
jgi:putative colanic acid biosynthesis acetyltransferase WcaF